MEEKFHNRHEAGILLAAELSDYAHNPNVLVLALPRGGVPVAYEVASRLGIALDVLVVRKLGVPGQEELALGAMASGGVVVFNDAIVRNFNLSPMVIEQVIQTETQELKRREKKYRGNHDFPNLTGKILILVDDGIATGATIRAGIKALQQHHPASVILAIPVAQIDTCQELEAQVDKVICLLKPQMLYAVGAWYEDFSQTSDEEVSELLIKANRELQP